MPGSTFLRGGSFVEALYHIYMWKKNCCERYRQKKKKMLLILEDMMWRQGKVYFGSRCEIIVEGTCLCERHKEWSD